MGELGEAIGTTTEGGLLARAVETRASGAEAEGDGHTHEAACLNCGTALIGPHCHSCGQRAQLHRTLGAFLHDLLHGVLHVEGKIWRTLPLLALKPGELTRRYIAGERARFVSPMALFLFSVFLMFAVFQLVGIGEGAVPEPGGGAAQTDATESVAPEKPDRRVYTGQEYWGERATTINTNWSFVDRGVAKWRQNPSLMAYKLQANSYKFSWLLIPLSIPFMSLLFVWRRRFGAYDHAVFITYSLAFMTQLFVAVGVLGALGVSDALLFLAVSLVPLAHIYKHLRGTYALSRFSALWRLAALGLFIAVILTIFLNLLLALGAF